MDAFINLYRIDLWLMKLINVDLANPELDRFWLWVTDVHKAPWFLIFALPALVLWAFYIYRREVWKPLVALTVTVAITDALSYRLVKAVFQRPRPFHNAEILEWLRHVGKAGGFSMPSNHAANVCGAAVILAWYFPRGRYFFYTLALVVSLSRVALGVHYPFDIAAGGLLGIFVGLLVRAFVLNQFSILQPRSLVSIKDRKSTS